MLRIEREKKERLDENAKALLDKEDYPIRNTVKQAVGDGEPLSTGAIEAIEKPDLIRHGHQTKTYG